jgi:hypothetical protein
VPKIAAYYSNEDKMQIADQDIGGARVRRVFTMRGEFLKAGHHLKVDEVLAIPIANRRALIDAGFLEIYPRGAPPSKHNEERFIIRTKGDHDKFDVIAGHKLNQSPLTRVEADRLAGRNGSGK